MCPHRGNLDEENEHRAMSQKSVAQNWPNRSQISFRLNLDARSVPEALVNSFRILTPLRTRLNPPEPEIRLPKNSIRISTPDPHNRVRHARNPVRNAPPPAIETLWRFFHGRGDFVNRPNRTDHADRDTLGFFIFQSCRSGFETLGFFFGFYCQRDDRTPHSELVCVCGRGSLLWACRNTVEGGRFLLRSPQCM